MTKMEKLGSNFLTADLVKAIAKSEGKCEVKFVSEPELTLNEKFGNKTYHVEVEIKDEDGKMTKKTWNMNTKTSDFLSEEFGGDTKDFIGKTVEIQTAKVSTKDGMKDTIYPADLM